MIDLKHGETYLQVLETERKFKEEVAKFYGVSPKNILPNNGSNGSLLTIFSSYSNKILFEHHRQPTILMDFPNYFRSMQLADEFNFKTIFVERDRGYNFPSREFLAKLSKKPDVVLLTSPNNPSGKAIPDKAIIAAIKLSSGLIILDRTLPNIDNEISTNDLLKEFPEKKLIILHSFSKLYGLAHERVGYAITVNEELIRFFTPKLNLGLNSRALQKAMITLHDHQLAASKKKLLKIGLKEIQKYNKKLYTYFPSQSSYALIKLLGNRTAMDLARCLLFKKIHIMPGPNIRLPQDTVRIHLSGIKEIKLFLESLKAFY